MQFLTLHCYNDRGGNEHIRCGALHQLEIVAAHLSASLSLSLSVFLSPAPWGYDSSFRITSVREETNNSVVKTRGELIVAAIKRVTIKRGYKSGRDPI